jgi:hypothetical protein
MTNATNQQHRSVSFNTAVVCISALHINNYTDEEIFNTWFTNKEYKEMKREVQLTISMMDKKATFAEGVNFSSRGLEHKTADMIVQKAEHRYFATDAVLEEQDCQREAGICDPDALRMVSTEYSFISHMAAFLIAATDEKFAEGYDGCLGSRVRDTKESPWSTIVIPYQRILLSFPHLVLSKAA